MSHTIHTTRAYVLSVRNVQEANRYYTLLTEDLGTIIATAQGVRFEKSKLRFALQKYSFAEVSLVFGRSGWRITNAYSFHNLFFSTEKDIQNIVINVTGLLKKLVVGETPDKVLFQAVHEGLSTLSLKPASDRDLFEILIVSRILAILGYGTDRGLIEKVGFITSFDDGGKDFILKEKPKIVREINRALLSTGL